MFLGAWVGFPANRAVFAVNRGLDAAFLKPVAMAYRDMTPQFFQDRINDALDNLRAPVILFNDVLRGELEPMPGFDVHTPLLSQPYLCGADMDTFPMTSLIYLEKGAGTCRYRATSTLAWSGRGILIIRMIATGPSMWPVLSPC